MKPLSRLLVLFGLAVACTGIAPAQDDPGSRRAAIEMMYPVMMQALEAKAFGRARNICDQAILWEPQNPVHHYNLACIEAQAGRLPQAISALELSVALGFNDAEHLQADTDLVPLRRDPKFTELVRKAMNNASADAAIAGLEFPRPARAAPQPAVTVEKPAPNSFKEGRPVGLFFTTRAPGGAWYFAPDGTVYRNLESGFSTEDLAAHTGPRGACRVAGGRLEVAWSDGRKTAGALKPDAAGASFTWNAGLFSAVKPFAQPGDLAATYEGIDAAAARRLELRADGTFTAGGGSTGTWQLNGLTVILTDSAGSALRRIAFPCGGEAVSPKPDRLYFGGTLYKRQP